MYLSNLAGALCTRIERVGPGRDIRRAVELARRAVDAPAASSPHRPARLAVLGLALRLEAEHSGDATALDEAVHVARSAAAASGIGHLERLDHLVNLAIVLRLRAEQQTDVVSPRATSTRRWTSGRPKSAPGRGVPPRRRADSRWAGHWPSGCAGPGTDGTCGTRSSPIGAPPRRRRRPHSSDWRPLTSRDRSPAATAASASPSPGSAPRSSCSLLQRGTVSTGARASIDSPRTPRSLQTRPRPLSRRADRTALWSSWTAPGPCCGHSSCGCAAISMRWPRRVLNWRRGWTGSALCRTARRARPTNRAGGVPDRRRQALAGVWDALVADARRVDGFAQRVTSARSGRAPVSEIVGGAASCDALLTTLPAHDEIHLACHVVQDPVDPPPPDSFLPTGW